MIMMTKYHWNDACRSASLVVERPTVKRRANAYLLSISILLAACAGPAVQAPSPTPPPSEAEAEAATADEPPAGLGRRDDATTLGPYEQGQPLVLLAHKSAEYSASVNSWLLEGPSEIGLVDAQMLVPEAEALVELLRSRNKRLAWVWVTHAHPDHYAGLQVIADAFPGVPLLAHPHTAQKAPELRAKFDEPLEKFFPGLLAPAAALTPHTETSLRVDGVEIEILTFEGGEHELSTALLVRSQRAMIIADLVYNHVHPWLNELDVDTLLTHVAALAAMPEVETFYPGHGEPFGKDFLPVYTTYVHDFLAELEHASDSKDLVTRTWRRYRDWRTLAGLRFSATAHIEAREASTTPASE